MQVGTRLGFLSRKLRVKGFWGFGTGLGCFRKLRVSGV